MVKRKNIHCDGITSTFSVIARCKDKKELGICVTSGSLAVGSVVPHVELDVGGVVIQGLTDIAYGKKGLELLKSGISPKDVLNRLLREDSKREFRQVMIMDVFGRTFAFTGKKTSKWAGHLIGKNYLVAGNMLSSSKVIKYIAKTFESSSGPIEDRLVSSIEAGKNAGGDLRGERSSALLVIKEQSIETRPYIDLRVDFNKNPVEELKNILSNYKEFYDLK